MAQKWHFSTKRKHVSIRTFALMFTDALFLRAQNTKQIQTAMKYH